MPTNFDDLLRAFRAYLLRLDAAPVRDFLGSIDWAMPERGIEAKELACLKYLPRVAKRAGPAERELAMRLAQTATSLCWRQTYTAADFGPDFIDKYGWVELFGTRGHFRNNTVAAGFLILGPGVLYPDHRHVSEEIYIPMIGGTEWRMGDDGFRERRGGEVIHHASNVNHAMRTGSEPLLALYLWRGGDLAQHPTVPRAASQGAR